MKPIALIRKLLSNHSGAWHANKSYSQEGEDLILDQYFLGLGDGFFVDVGAHHPFRFSNTYKLYRRGWSGINIDPLPGSMRLFKQSRPRDINLEIGIASKASELTYYEFDEPALNGFNQELSQERNRSTPYRILRTSLVQVRPLADVLKESVPHGKSCFEVLSVDAEGFDLDVLQSNNWQKFRPKVVIAELRKTSLSQVAEDPIFQYLTSLGYKWFACTGRSCFFESVTHDRP